LKNVGEAAEARQKQAKKRSLRVVNEHFEPVFNDASATQVVFQGLLKPLWSGRRENSAQKKPGFWGMNPG
jgi:hypothetical protein